MHTLKAPGEITEQAERVVDLADQQLNVLGALVDAAQDNDFAKVRELDSENKRVNQEANSVMSELGADACAEDT